MLDQIIQKLNSMEVFSDGIIVIDTAGIIQYHTSSKLGSPPSYDPGELVGMHLFEAYPSLNPQNSTLYKALRGIPTYNQLQRQTNYRGEVVSSYETTLPIRSGGEITGAVSFTKIESRLLSEISLDQADFAAIAPASDASQSLIGNSPVIRKVRERIARISKTDASVLLYGETGTGKGLAAKAIHCLSARRTKPFLEQNCAAIPSNLLESLFFGTVRGSYTGAVDAPGLLRQCSGGTLFLDELNSMDLNLQSKLLKVLESGRVTPLGSRRSYPIDVRIIAAINEHPVACLRNRKIRSDLFYRLCTVQLELPPLTSRIDDLDLLCSYFLKQYSQNGNSVLSLSPEVLDTFRRYSWPGNVRELKNLIEGACVYASGNTIQPEDLPSYLFDARWNRLNTEEFVAFDGETDAKPDAEVGLVPPSSRPLPTLKEAATQWERQFLSQRMNAAKTKKELAESLGITYQTLYLKLHKYGLIDAKEKQ